MKHKHSTVVNSLDVDIGRMAPDELFEKNGPLLTKPNDDGSPVYMNTRMINRYRKLVLSNHGAVELNVGGIPHTMGKTIAEINDIKVRLNNQPTPSKTIVLYNAVEYVAEDEWMIEGQNDSNTFIRQMADLHGRDEFKDNMKYMIDSVITADSAMIIEDFGGNPSQDLAFAVGGVSEGVVDIAAAGTGNDHMQILFERKQGVVVFRYKKVNWPVRRSVKLLHLTLWPRKTRNNPNFPDQLMTNHYIVNSDKEELSVIFSIPSQ